MRSFWITGATDGLGLALVEQALEHGHRVAASGKDSQKLDTLGERFGARLLRLPGQLQEAAQADQAGQRLKTAWSTLDTLIINAGSADYLGASLAPAQLFEALVSSNLKATALCLERALPLLSKGERPQVMAVLSRHAAQQLFEPNQPPSGSNSLAQWLREQRRHLQAQGIDLTVVAPQPLKSPLPLAMPEDWTPERTAQVLLERLDLRQPELVLEVLNPNNLWPLSR